MSEVIENHAQHANQLEEEVFALFRKHFPVPDVVSAGIATAALFGVIAQIYTRTGQDPDLGVQLFRELCDLYCRMDLAEQPADA